MPAEKTTVKPSVRDVLAGAVEALGGQERPGQIQMAEAVARAMSSGEHLLVQAGTGTGKSLGYLVPALLHHRRVVVATATLALQHQLVERDIPALLDAAEHVLAPATSSAGRRTPCSRAAPTTPACTGSARACPTTRARSSTSPRAPWAPRCSSSAPGRRRSPSAAAPATATPPPSTPTSSGARSRSTTASASARPSARYAAECFAERAKEKAAESQVVVTNHSLLAIDAIEGVPMIPEYDVVVIDEAHELSARVTQAATDELSRARDRAGRPARAAAHRRHTRPTTSPTPPTRCATRSTRRPPGRLDSLPAVARRRAGPGPRRRPGADLRVPQGARGQGGAGGADPGRTQARGWVQEIYKTAERMAANVDSDVLWLAERDRNRGGNQLCVAPLQVWGPLRDKLLTEKTVVFTCATLMLGGDFNSVATSIGLKPSERVDHSLDEGAGATGPAAADSAAGESSDKALPWRGIDVGSPFDYARQGILYVARHLPPPGRDGLGQAQLDEIVDLVDAADGRTLGLFSSRRAAEAAAEALRERLPHLTILAQGEAQLPELARLFVEDPHACLFGTLSLWQGLDVPGDTCQLVLIDRIPFPRPDDPLMSARQRAADQAGGNGFMSVAATHAALLLAQGAGRLIRTTTDRGVVAILDPRLVTARYGGFLRASLPPMWPTTDRAVVLAALKRLAG